MKRLAQLTSEGERVDGSLSVGVWGGTVLSRGSRGSAVDQVQFWLDSLSLYDASLAVNIDSSYGASTESAVRSYQRLRGLTADGKVGKTTWDALFRDYSAAQNDADGQPSLEYPGSPLRRGDRGSAVRRVQFWLRMAASLYTALPTPGVDGIFGGDTENAVRRFQSYFGLGVDGVVGRATWNKLTEVYRGVTNSLLSPSLRPGEYPGVLRPGSRGNPVRELQYYLVLLAAYNGGMNAPVIDGIYGSGTSRAVRDWQSLQGLGVDGIVGPATWSSIYSEVNRLRSSGPVVVVRQRPYPGAPLQMGDCGPDVEYITRLLNLVAFSYPEVRSPGPLSCLDEKGGEAVQSFQRRFALPVTGTVDGKTWEVLEAVSADLLARGGAEEGSGDYPGYALAQGSMGSPVYLAQQWLNALAEQDYFYRYVPESGQFGEQTRDAVLVLQAVQALPETGILDRASWDALRAAAQG